MAQPIVFNIQRFSIHDGDGIRTTVFFKGCPLRCSWCHNPESQSYTHDLMHHIDRCTACGNCVKACPNKAISIVEVEGEELPEVITDRTKCTKCGDCVDECFSNAREIVGGGKQYTPRELFKVCLRDWMFYEESGGGITLSGGEVMSVNQDYIEDVLKLLSEMEIPVNIDTSGCVPYSRFERINKYVDTYLYDLKIMDPVAHKIYIGTDNQQILDNLINLSRDNQKIYLRLPLIDGINATDEHIDSVINFLTENNITPNQINLLMYHDTGAHKYKKLGMEYKCSENRPPDELWMTEIETKFKKNGFMNIVKGG